MNAQQKSDRTVDGAVPDHAGFPAALDEATAIAALSPSSHNCQPWGLARLTSGAACRAAARHFGSAPGGDDAGSEYLALGLDGDRSLGALPAHEVEMFVSCGAYWQTLLRALDSLGWSVHRLDLPAATGREVLGAGWPAGWMLLALVELRRTGRPDGTLDGLRAVARARRTNRAPYTPRAVASDMLAGLERPVAGAVPTADIDVRHLTGPDLRRFARLVSRYAGLDFSHGPAWRETYSYIRRDDTEAAELGTGFTLPQLFGRMSAVRQLLLRCALAPATLRILRFGGYHRVLADRLAAVVRRSAAISVLAWDTPAPDRAEMVRGGARLADYWLRATRYGLALHPVSVVIEHDGPRHVVEDVFGLPGRVFFVSRLGHPATAFPPSPRRPVASTLREL
ncbi:RedV protein [Streptomyces caeni]|uniref:RedV protein n=1 Tax=Streptomyces caeni TaxID=2307231 RepID=A0ABW4IUR2_9ACTN